MTLDKEKQIGAGVGWRRLMESAFRAEGSERTGPTWVVPVAILGTAGERLTQMARSRAWSDSPGLPSVARAAHLDLHDVFGQAALNLGLCYRRDRRHVLADAAMSLFAAWLVEADEVAPARLGESADHLVHRWALDRSLQTVMRELSTAASTHRLRRLAIGLGAEGLGTLLRAELAASVRLSGAALALSDYARMAPAREAGTRR